MTFTQFGEREAQLHAARRQLDLDHAALLDQLGREGHPQLIVRWVGDEVEAEIEGRPGVWISFWDTFVSAQVPGHGRWQEQAATHERRVAYLLLYLHTMGILS